MKHEPLNNSRTCAVCEKSFIVHPGAGWLYKTKTNSKTTWYCSYKCMRQAEKQRGTANGI